MNYKKGDILILYQSPKDLGRQYWPNGGDYSKDVILRDKLQITYIGHKNDTDFYGATNKYGNLTFPYDCARLFTKKPTILL